MKPKYEPCPGNAPGPFYVVRGECLACWAAVDQAPELMDGDGEPPSPYHCRFHRQPRTEEEVGQALDAIAVCCTLGVRYAGTDKLILDRLASAHHFQWSDVLADPDDLGLPPNPS